MKLTSGQIPIPRLPTSTSVNLTKLDLIIRALLGTLERNNGKNPLTEFVDNVCGGNIRLALDLTRNFFGSGHVDTDKIADIQEEEGKSGQKGYVVPLHEFLRAVIYGDAAFYDPTQSPIANIFDVTSPDGREHFLQPLLLGLLDSLSSKSLEGGFVETDKIYERLQALGFNADQIDDAIVRASKAKLVESYARRVPEAGRGMPSAFRVTTVGMYHLLRLTQEFPYFDAIVVDTPILDEHLRGQIRDVHTIADRLNRAEIFVRYLDHQWPDFGPAESTFDWTECSSAVHSEIDRIRNAPRVTGGPQTR